MSTDTLSRPAPPRFHPFRDSTTMLRRNLKRMLRYPSLTLTLVGMPVVFLLLFVYVFGGTLGAGLGGPAPGDAAGGRSAYVNYVTPAIILMTVTSIIQGTAVSVAMDLTEGIIARFRTMHIARASVLTGHVLASMIQAAFALTLVTGVALLVGFRPEAGLTGWLATAGFLAAMTFALVWLAVALGQVSKTVESASNVLMPLVLLPFLGSGFVPTDSLPAGLRWFAEYQPFTPMTETLRALLMDEPLGDNGWIALAWCAGIALGSYLWSKRLFNREPAN
ncbi:ABC transporter permease [Streptomonospora nanhaiensis]|uniref:Transport permease protein n=1 Tax=Streptomonospora nanhaiensis TaxID=1323731 RepID=A0A853BR77_9ACTN|nr:ABC transporter permease [Streptomonospora nanhaiensis]MBV2363837.1 ABC transporter permease [Streptomonospora nanhaiensis]MBX9389858.1 ABC transporter permease [Streptomonospora nanhaiensis]NYI96862.1 ABC-2 type transport system permease protein [Streptomonospora nanhaiensis]